MTLILSLIYSPHSEERIYPILQVIVQHYNRIWYGQNKTVQQNNQKNPTRMEANAADLATSMVIHLSLEATECLSTGFNNTQNINKS